MVETTAEVLEPRVFLRILPAAKKLSSNHPLANPKVRKPIRGALVKGFEGVDVLIKTGNKLANKGRKGRERLGRFIHYTRQDPEVQKAALSVLAIAVELLPNNSVGRIAREVPTVIKGAQAVIRYWSKYGKDLLTPSPEAMRLLTS